jgi:hypothetical protein
MVGHCAIKRKGMVFLKKKKFAVMDWPGKSPDLNQIKNLRLFVKGKLMNDNIFSLSLLIRAIRELFDPPVQAPEDQAGPLSF